MDLLMILPTGCGPASCDAGRPARRTASYPRGVYCGCVRAVCFTGPASAAISARSLALGRSMKTCSGRVGTRADTKRKAPLTRV